MHSSRLVMNGESFVVRFELDEEQPSSSTQRQQGRPSKSFSELGARGKRNQVSGILEEGAERLLHASHLALYPAGHRLASRSLTIRNISKNPQSPITSETSQDITSRKWSIEECLAILIETQSFCIWLRIKFAAIGLKQTLSFYRRIQEAKNAGEKIVVTDTPVDIPLQAVKDLTCERLCMNADSRSTTTCGSKLQVFHAHQQVRLRRKWQ